MTKSLLIVDDEDSMRRLCSRIFSGCGYEISVAGTLAEAARMTTGRNFDLVITDLNLPDGFGTEVILSARKGGRQPGTILISGSASPQELERLALKAGANAYFEKPFDTDSLLAAAEKLLK